MTFSAKKSSTTNLCNVNFKYIATTLIESYEVKFLSRCYLQRWITIHSSWISMYSFVRRVGHFNDSIFAVVHFLSLKKKIKRNISFFARQMYFQVTQVLLIPGQAARPRLVWNGRLHVESVFNFLGATRSEVDRRCQTNSTQGSYKLLQKLFLSPSLKLRLFGLWKKLCATWQRKYRAKGGA